MRTTAKLQTHDPVISKNGIFTQLQPKLLFFKPTGYMPKHNRYWDTKKNQFSIQVPSCRLTQKVGILQT
jgi:hypothetical protein